MKEQARFSVADGQFESRVRESFNRQGLMRHLGAELVEVTAGQVTIRVPFRTELGQLNLLAPADGEELTARARVLRSGRTLKVCAADVHAKKNGEEVHC